MWRITPNCWKVVRMMVDREKLIELLREVQYLGGLEERIADHLIANGVTVQRWIPVTERRPEENDVYMVSAFDGHARRITFAQWQTGSRDGI